MSRGLGSRPADALGRRWRGISTSLKILVPTVAALGAGAAIAVAQIGGSDSTITGCVQVSTGDGPAVGSLRIIDPAATSCTTGETTIAWNEQGPQGATGPTGPQGPAGPAGAAGAQGPAGTAPVSSIASADITMVLTPTGNLGQLNPTPVGETTQKNAGATKAFDLSSFTLDAQNSLAIGSATAGAGAGKVSFQAFSFTKPLDKYSAQLFQDLASGTRIASVEIIVRKPGNDGMDDPIVQYLLKNVGLTNIHISGASKNATETVQGAFQAISFVLYGQNSNGTTPVTSTGGWSQVTNQPVTIPGLGPVGTIRDTHRRK
ncbi:MAG: type VI secretion system tube protein Hcp [Solirubrobacteraceae bacterium]